VNLHFAPPAVLVVSASRLPAARARRHWLADIRDTPSRMATPGSLAPASIILRRRQPHLLPTGRLRRR
jgi:hypothetical protein